MMAASIVIYSTLTCPFCIKAKSLIESKGLQYEEIRVDTDSNNLAEMIARTNGNRSVPQIFINNKYIGGFSELKALNDTGKLDELLQF